MRGVAGVYPLGEGRVRPGRVGSSFEDYHLAFRRMKTQRRKTSAWNQPQDFLAATVRTNAPPFLLYYILYFISKQVFIFMIRQP